MSTIVVSGAIANKNLNGGEAWVRLNWILGFKKLGFNVYFVEQIDREDCTDVAGEKTDFENSSNLAFFKRVMEQFGLTNSSALIHSDDYRSYGLTYAEVRELAASTDLLVNISGHLTLESLMCLLRRKAYIDIDPGFTQFWHASGGTGLRLEGHDFYFTIGENIGILSCPIPTGEICWRKTRQPVVLDQWPVTEGEDPELFTTIASWRGPYGPIQYGGRTLGLKVHEFRRFIELPRRSRQKFEVALNIHPAEEKDLALLHHNGWRLVNPKSVARDPSSFRRYVQKSGAEFSVAQGVYVETDSGWFSDRTVRYLASGKPALVQDTGFSRNLPVGEGLVPFRVLEDAVAGAELIARDYEKHCCAARAIAEEYFDSDRILRRLTEEVGVAP